VTANYTLSFDSLRSVLSGKDCFILVLDTKGINVWCAAGKGTFGSDELVHQIEKTKLHEIVANRKLILPQLGAPGVAAHEVKQRSGFNIEFGPIRAKDLLEYLKTHKTTLEMRQVKFNFIDRLILIPVELIHFMIPILIIALLLYLVGDFLFAAGAAVAILAGVVLFPILLPWIPTPNFSTKGFVLGGVVAIVFSVLLMFNNQELKLWQHVVNVFALLLLLPPITAFLTLNFTGSTTFTSRSGVKREIFTYIPKMVWMFGGGVFLLICLILIHIVGS